MGNIVLVGYCEFKSKPFEVLIILNLMLWWQESLEIEWLIV